VQRRLSQGGCAGHQPARHQQQQLPSSLLTCSSWPMMLGAAAHCGAQQAHITAGW
jgi:hypothetical protein